MTGTLLKVHAEVACPGDPGLPFELLWESGTVAALLVGLQASDQLR